tara:strand:- start:1639 stop:4233 length:2595 start_codon:yes stop_codon:yes gene_type:complete
MPKIPTYDQLGQRVKAPTQFNVRADTQAFVGAQLATADLFKKAGNIAYEFGMKEKEENTKAAFAELKTQYNNEVNDVIRNSKAISTSEAENELNEFNKKFEKNYTKKNLTPNQLKSIKTQMVLHQGAKMQVGKNLAFDRGRDYNSTLHKNASNNLIIEINKLPIGNPLRNAMEDELRETINVANENGETANLTYKTVDQAFNAIKINDYTSLSGNAQSIEQIQELKDNLKNESFMADTSLKLSALLDAEEKRVHGEYADAIARSIFVSNDKALTNEKEFEKKIQRLNKSELISFTNDKGVKINVNPKKLPVNILETIKAKAQTRRNELLSKEINDIKVNLTSEVQGKSLSELKQMLNNVDATGENRYRPEIESFASREQMKQIINNEMKDKAKRAIADSMTTIDNISSDLRADGVISDDNKKRIDEVRNTFILAGEYQKANEFNMKINAEIKASSAFQSIKFSSSTESTEKLNELKLKWQTSGKKEDELTYTSFANQVAVRDAAIKKDFIGYYKSQNPGEEITVDKMISLQKQMDVDPLNIRVTSNAELEAFEAAFKAPGLNYAEKAQVGKDFLNSYGAHQNKVLRHLISSGTITPVDNLLLAYPNDVRIKGAILANAPETVKGYTAINKQDRETIVESVTLEMANYSQTVLGGGFDDVLGGGFTKGRAGHVMSMREIIVNTANYYKQLNNMDPADAAKRAFNEVIGNHFNLDNQVNGTTIRFGVEYDAVAKPMAKILETSITNNVEYLKEIVEAPPPPLGLDDSAKEQWENTYYNDLSKRGTWRTTTDNTGVYLVDQVGNMVKRKDSAMEPGDTGGMAPFVSVNFDSLTTTLDKYKEIQEGQGMIQEKDKKLIDHFKNTGQLF